MLRFEYVVFWQGKKKPSNVLCKIWQNWFLMFPSTFVLNLLQLSPALPKRGASAYKSWRCFTPLSCCALVNSVLGLPRFDSSCETHLQLELQHPWESCSATFTTGSLFLPNPTVSGEFKQQNFWYCSELVYLHAFILYYWHCKLFIIFVFVLSCAWHSAWTILRFKIKMWWMNEIKLTKL